MGAMDNTQAQSPRGKTERYTPSWADRLTDWIDGLPGSAWPYYLGSGTVVLVALAVAIWSEGDDVLSSFPVPYLFYVAATPFFMALFRILDGEAGKALDSMRSTLTASEDEIDDLRYRLTTLPWGPTLWWSLVVFAVTIPFDYLSGAMPGVDGLSAVTASAVVAYVIYRILWWVMGALLYHTVHQLRMIDHILTRRTRIEVFCVAPLYAFSNLTALTALGIVGPPYLFLALNPGSFYEAAALAQVVPILLLGVAVFVWPMVGVHRLLVAEKARLSDESATRLKATLARLHERVDSGNLSEMDDLSKAIGLLEAEQRALKGVPTWPWDPATVRLLISAIALPLGLWLIQLILERLMVN
jgi:hypothetical protein